MIKIFKKFFYFILCLLLFLQLLIIFLPKEQIFNYLIEKAKVYHIVFHSQAIKDKGVKFTLINNRLIYDGLKVASSKDINADLFIVYSTITITNVKLSEIVESMVPDDISIIKFLYSPYMLYHIKFKANGKMGIASGDIDLLHKKIMIDLKPSKLMRTRYSATLRQMKKSNKGYRYVYNF